MALAATAEFPFRYDGHEFDPEERRLVCRYVAGGRPFVETVVFDVSRSDGFDDDGSGWASPAAEAAARLVYLLAGVSYYKTTASELVDLGATATTADERRFLLDFYRHGLAEFAHHNGRDLSGLRITGPDKREATPVPWSPPGERPLVPFGGGLDSIVTAEAVRERHPGASLFVVSREGVRFDAIERAAAVAGLPVVRADRRIDPALLSSRQVFLNGHVPVTGILSAIAVFAAAGHGHDSVVMSNEWSASAPTLTGPRGPVNHQWSKSLAFETSFRALLARTFEPGADYFSYLRSRSELWVARHFSALDRYHGAFRSCNRAFAADPARRLDRWCAQCDKCCFIDLVLAPFLPPATLAAVFGGSEPLDDPALLDTFRSLAGVGGPRPFECVGDEDECRAAVRMAAARPDRARAAVLQALAGEVASATRSSHADDDATARLFGPMSPDFVPVSFADDGDTDP